MHLLQLTKLLKQLLSCLSIVLSKWCAQTTSFRPWNFLWVNLKSLPSNGNKNVNTSGYHQQTDGSVEKFNSTLVNMLSKVVQNMLVIGTDIYLLFAYQSTLQTSNQRISIYLTVWARSKTAHCPLFDTGMNPIYGWCQWLSHTAYLWLKWLLENHCRTCQVSSVKYLV